MPAALAARSRWPDGSVRWLSASLTVTLSPFGRSTLELYLGHDREAPSTAAGTIEPSRVTVPRVTRSDTGFRLNDAGSGTIASLALGIDRHDGSGELVDLRFEHEIGDDGVTRDRLLARVADTRTTAKLTLEADPVTGDVVVELLLHNTAHARHPGGNWDLGDPASILLRALSVRIDPPAPCETLELRTVADAPLQSLPLTSPLTLEQASSGGRAWDSATHVAADDRVHLRFRGWRLYRDGRVLEEGERASPVASLVGPSGALALFVDGFWEQFPTALEASPTGLTISFAGTGEDPPLELQPGERLRRRFVLRGDGDLDAARAALAPLAARPSAETIVTSRALPWFDATPREEAIHALLAPASSFVDKRERIDEYGWRNHGEVFADHETLYQKPDDATLVSHYNNQYDAVLGFLRQGLRGDAQFAQLSAELAGHVCDIDLYHTSTDRPEYNGGMFWHTDHYLPARTATHRTFSNRNTVSSTPGQTGGGPGSEHCYASGLALQYQLTGKEDYREAVLSLAKWMRELMDAPGLLQTCLLLRRHHLSAARRLLAGARLLPHRLPFTRATGNYLNVLLDAYETTDEQQWLDHAERVIQDCIHPDDDIAERDLLDIEIGWSYTILLTAICRFLWIADSHDRAHHTASFARAALLHYGRWMAEHERPYLEQQAALEYENHTWVAQDVRKAFVLQCAARHADSLETREQLQTAATRFVDYVTRVLSDSPEREFARIQIILMQNDGLHALRDARTMTAPTSLDVNWPARRRGAVALAADAAHRLLRALLQLSPRREWRWLRARLAP